MCPADIPLPDLLRDLRHDETMQKLSAPRWRLGMRMHGWLARHPGLYHALTGLGIFMMHLLGRRKGSFASLPLAGGWTSERDFPAPQGKTFMHQYAASQRASQAQKSTEAREQRSKTGARRKPDPRRTRPAGSKSGKAPGRPKAPAAGPRGKKPRRRQPDDR